MTFDPEKALAGAKLVPKAFQDRPMDMILVVQCRALAAQCREDDEKMTPAPWDPLPLIVRLYYDERPLASNAWHVARARRNLAAIAEQLTAAAGMEARYLDDLDVMRATEADLQHNRRRADAAERDLTIARAERDAARADVERLERELSRRPLRTFDYIGAERLADEVAVLVRRRVIDARSPAGDALLDYREPPTNPRADRMAELEAEVERLRAGIRAASEMWPDEAMGALRKLAEEG